MDQGYGLDSSSIPASLEVTFFGPCFSLEQKPQPFGFTSLIISSHLEVECPQKHGLFLSGKFLVLTCPFAQF